MIKQKIAQAAPMPSKDEDIRNNSMKLLSYLNTIAGLANYPSYTRMFRQKNLVLTKIYEATGITDKTVKLYLYYLEQNNMIEYRGLDNSDRAAQFDFYKIKEQDYSSSSEYRKALQKYTYEVWNIRNRKENKNGVYHIIKPSPYTQVPEVTLAKLNEDYQITELELDIYLFLCKYRDNCINNNLKYKCMTYEDFRDILGLVSHANTNKTIFNALCFLGQLNLIKFTMGSYINKKNAKIPLFKIEEVNYYISPLIEFGQSDILSEEERNELKEVNKRVQLGYNKTKQRE